MKNYPVLSLQSFNYLLTAETVVIVGRDNVESFRFFGLDAVTAIKKGVSMFANKFACDRILFVKRVNGAPVDKSPKNVE